MKYSAALTSEVNNRLLGHLVRPDRQEDLCFALWFPSQGRDRLSALVAEPILPEPGERAVHGNASFLPQYFERALGLALSRKAGLAFLHSHLGPGWQGMSDDDIAAEQGHALQTLAVTGLPLVGLTAGRDGTWSARFWTKTAPRVTEPSWCESVRVVGDRYAIHYNERLRPKPRARRELLRTVSAWGPAAQADLARLRIGVVGTGSVGVLVATALAHMGVGHLRLIDFDAVEHINRDRLLFATALDARRGRAKVAVLARALKRCATAAKFQVDALEWSVVEAEGFAAALDCDILFSCVDRPWGRSALNLIAAAHLIPVVDGGIAVETRNGNTGLKRADWRAHLVCPGRACLECLGQYDPGLVSLDRDGYLDDPRYISGLPDDHPVKRNENVFAFSQAVASLEVLQMLSYVLAPLGRSNPGAQHYHFVTGMLDSSRTTCKTNCLYRSLTARGDRSGISVVGRHGAAEAARRLRASSGH